MNRKGFTLIELLIVVAIIAILAAIAVPNFLEAQIRAKTSRTKADLRTLATAIESYAVDWNKEAPETGGAAATGPYAELLSMFDVTYAASNGITGTLGPSITTPVAYITSFTFKDPFFGSSDSATAVRADIQIYSYKAYNSEWVLDPNKAEPKDSQGISYGETGGGVGVPTNLTGAKFKELYSNWRLFSVGPDRNWGNKTIGTANQFPGGPKSVGLPYDPTNGTISLGSITRSGAQSDQKSWFIVNGQ